MTLCTIFFLLEYKEMEKYGCVSIHADAFNEINASTFEMEACLFMQACLDDPD